MPGSVFLICTTPLLKMLTDILGSDAMFAFADDIAICVHSLHQLPAVYKTFCAFTAATSLRLKPAKCVLIPLKTHGWTSAACTAAYAELLAKVVPAWRDFQIKGESKYLGFVIGPAATP